MNMHFKPFAAALSVALASVMMTGCLDLDNKKPAAAAPRATEVDVTVVESTDATIVTELGGRTNAYRIADVRPQVSGIILKRLFEEGAEVKKGQSLYQIDPALFEASVQSARAAVLQAEANLKKAKADAKRSAELVKVKAMSASANDAAQAAYRVAEANLAAAKASLKTAQVNLGYTHVKSPIAGRVSISQVTPGALVTAQQGTPLTTVHQLDPIYVDVTQSYEKLAELRAKMDAGIMKTDPSGDSEVQLVLDSGEIYHLKGKFSVQDALVNETSGTVRIRAVFPNPDRELMPGMYVRARLIEGIQPNVVKLDQRAVMRAQNGAPYCFVVGKDNKVESRYLTIDGAEGNFWIVTKGLEVGEKVIVEGILKVRPGASVTFKDPAAKQAK
jgi:membrane fusion protein (multidrug efflux system)